MTLLKPLNNTTILIPYILSSIPPKGRATHTSTIIQWTKTVTPTSRWHLLHPRGETSRAASLTPNTQSMLPHPGPPSYYNIRYVLSNTFNIHIRTYLISIAFPHNNVTLLNNEFTQLWIYYIQNTTLTQTLHTTSIKP